MLSSIFGGDKEEKEIQTHILKVRGKTLIFANTIYSIPNLSVVEVGEIRRRINPLFYLALLLGIGSFLLDGVNFIVILSFAAAGGLYYWHYINKKHGLRLVTNSGETTVIVSADLDFLKRVALTLNNLINCDLIAPNINFNLDQRQIIEVGVNEGQVIAGGVTGDVVSGV